MKAIQTAMLNAHLYRVEAEVTTKIKALFGRCPELAGFAVQELAAVHDLIGLSLDGDQPGGNPTLIVTDIGFSASISAEEVEAAYTLIGTAISDVMSERPEAFELIRGRTFARTLH